jgi:hypothetical protein
MALLNARRAGASLSVHNGKLRVSSDEPLSEDVIAALREHRDRLVEILNLEREPLAGVERLNWRAWDHVCSTACKRMHVVCNACRLPLRPHEQHWPHLHLNCRLELAD